MNPNIQGQLQKTAANEAKAKEAEAKALNPIPPEVAEYNIQPLVTVAPGKSKKRKPRGTN